MYASRATRPETTETATQRARKRLAHRRNEMSDSTRVPASRRLWLQGAALATTGLAAPAYAQVPNGSFTRRSFAFKVMLFEIRLRKIGVIGMY